MMFTTSSTTIRTTISNDRHDDNELGENDNAENIEKDSNNKNNDGENGKIAIDIILTFVSHDQGEEKLSYSS